MYIEEKSNNGHGTFFYKSIRYVTFLIVAENDNPLQAIAAF